MSDDTTVEEYLRDERRVQDEIWSCIPNARLAVDVGVGNSTRWLAERGLMVVGIECDEAKAARVRENTASVEIVVADFLAPPLRDDAADLVVFCSTLHEIDPRLHGKAILEARRIARWVMVVEPSPHGCPAYEKYARLWSEAMHSIGYFEDYKPLEYWVRLLKENGFKITCAKTVKWTTPIPYQVFKEITAEATTLFRQLGVSEEYVKELENLLEEAKRGRIKWSDIIVVVGENSSYTHPSGHTK